METYKDLQESRIQHRDASEHKKCDLSSLKDVSETPSYKSRCSSGNSQHCSPSSQNAVRESTRLQGTQGELEEHPSRRELEKPTDDP